MRNENIENEIIFHDLKWDTDYFGVTCAKVILNKPLKKVEWDALTEKFNHYQFISIENRNSESVNARLIGNETKAYLVDVNVQFTKKIDICTIDAVNIEQNEIKIYQSLPYDERIVKMANFPFSKFIDDPELAKRGGNAIYRQWLINSFGKPDKFYAVAVEADGKMNGFLLHSYFKKKCTVELIAVSNKKIRGGIGSALIKMVENAARRRGCDELKVGTQIRNLGAINFYQKCGFKQVECHQIYHLWRIL
jgi:dTDP-4-amino-4,6-dideoxy-D-galactose acyltransferase